MALRTALLLAMAVAVAAQGATCEEDEAGLLQKTSVESLKVAKANSTVACDCNPTCPGCGCHYAVPTEQWCNINGVQTACPSSGLCQDAAKTAAPTPAPGLLQKTSVESLKVAKANSTVACDCNPTCPGCGCHYAVPTEQWCNINGVQTACPSSGLCQDAAKTAPPTPAPGLLQKTSVESLKVAKANSTVACDCNPTCPGCGCHYAVPTEQWCNINGVQTACPSSGLCQDAASDFCGNTGKQCSASEVCLGSYHSWTCAGSCASSEACGYEGPGCGKTCKDRVEALAENGLGLDDAMTTVAGTFSSDCECLASNP